MSCKLVAHRGESIAAPENTLEAFELAWLRGTRCIEGDFHLSKDGVVVCMHDDNAKRTCGVDRNLADMTFSEIGQLDAGVYKGDEWKYTRVPSLSQILERMPTYGEIYIELKSVGPIVPALKEVFAGAKQHPEQLTFIAFDEATIVEVKKLFPAHHAYWLTCNWVGAWDERDKVKFTPDELAQKLCDLAVDGVDIFVDNIDQSYVEAVHRAGKTFHVWTVDDAATAKRVIGYGIDSLTTNRAHALNEEI